MLRLTGARLLQFLEEESRRERLAQTLRQNATGDPAELIMVIMTNLSLQHVVSVMTIRSVLVVLSLIASTPDALAFGGRCELDIGPRLTASDGAAGDVFGLSGSVDGDVLAIGAIWDDDHGFNSGAVYVLVLNDQGVWKATFKITPADGGSEDVFGRSVAISGDTIVVGANGDDDRGFDAGAGYAFARVGDTWIQQGKLLASDGAAFDHAGWAVDVDGDTAVISAHDDDDAGGDSGAVNVFVRDGEGVWSQQAKLTASDAAADDNFGHDAVVSGDTIMVGAYQDDDHGSSSGSVYVFERDRNGQWQETEKLTASDANEGYHFGRFLDLQGDLAVIGSPFHHPLDFGAAYVFRRNEGKWQETATLTADILTTSEWFGSSIAIDGDMVLIGSFYGFGNHPGEAYIFHDTGDGWTLAANPTAFDGVVGDGFGRMVTMNGGNAIVGASVDDAVGVDSGSAYAFSIDCPEPIAGDIDGDGTVGTTDLLLLLAAWGPCRDCDDCPADLDQSCAIGTSDLLILLGNWGDG